MNELATQHCPALLPVSPRREVAIRVATLGDLPFLDAMQKQHGRALGYFPTKQFEGYIGMGAVLIAHDGAEPLGYIIARDRYLKRDELGVVYQLCVAPGDQRKLIGATLVRAVFERSAYGCKLYCCWCAQDLPANHFWESMGFIPIAFRAGGTLRRSSGQGGAASRRVHIFWQRRINDGDTGERATPYWYPCQTNSGAIREDRLVFPIPPGTHWKDVQAGVLPTLHQPTLEAPKPKAAKRPRPQPALRPALVPLGGFRFQSEQPPPQAKPTRERVQTPKVKIDPALVAKARELRDRCMERQDEWIGPATGKYDVSRTLSRAVANERPVPLLKGG